MKKNLPKITPSIISHAVGIESTRKVAEIEALHVLLKVRNSGLPGASGVPAIKSVFCTKNRSTRHHPFRVVFISELDKPGTYCMHQCFISNPSYSEFQTELPTKSYGILEKSENEKWKVKSEKWKIPQKTEKSQAPGTFPFSGIFLDQEKKFSISDR